MKRASASIAAALALASMVACGRNEPPAAAPSKAPAATPASAPVEAEAEPVAEVHGSNFDFDELSEHIDDVYRYPPTACRLEAMLGAEGFVQLREQRGLYPNDLDEGSLGRSYYGRECPQPDCASALTWVGPEGDIIVASVPADINVGGGARIVIPRASYQGALPLAVERFVADRSSREWVLAEVEADTVCVGDALEERRRRFLAAADYRACDPEFSWVWQPAAIVPASGDRAYFWAEPGERREAYVVAGDLVVLGMAHADDPAFVCARFVSLAGKQTTGWLASNALIVLDQLDDAVPARAELDRFVVGPTPAWLELGAPALRLGDLSIRRSASDEVEVALERVMSQHVCTLRGALELAGPRVLVDRSAGCGAAGVVFNNGVFVWENGDCSGARATCTGGYVPNSSPP